MVRSHCILCDQTTLEADALGDTCVRRPVVTIYAPASVRVTHCANLTLQAGRATLVDAPAPPAFSRCRSAPLLLGQMVSLFHRHRSGQPPLGWRRRLSLPDLHAAVWVLHRGSPLRCLASFL
jgi:hypothetical protein